MPVRAPHACVPGCGARVEYPARRCEAHTREYHRRIDERRGSSSSRGYGVEWQRLRLSILALHPLCSWCRDAGLLVTATDVDHIVPLAEGGTNDDTNLRSLCKSCHSARTMRDQVNGARA